MCLYMNSAMSCKNLFFILIFGSVLYPTLANIHMQKAVDKPFPELQFLMNSYWNENAHSRDLTLVFFKKYGRNYHTKTTDNVSFITDDIVFPTGKPTRVYNHIKFQKTLSDSWMPENLLNSDILFLSDFLGTQTRTPFIRYESSFILCVSPIASGLGFSTVVNGIAVLDQEDIVYAMDFKPYEDCALLQKHITTYQKENILKSTKYEIKRMPREPLKKECALEMIIDFLLYRYGRVNMTLEEVQNHPILKILTTVSALQNTSIIPVYRNDIKKWVINDKTHLLFMDGNYIFQYEPQEASIYLGSEDIVWLIINISDPLLNLKTIVQTTAVLVCVVAIVLLFGNLLNRFLLNTKLPFVRLLILAWSIFLSISVPRQPNNVMPRIIFLGWTISSSVLIMCYYMKSYNSLAFPIISRLHTQEELMRSDIKILAISAGYANTAFKKDDINNIIFDDIRPFDMHFKVGKHEQLLKRMSLIMEMKEEFALLLDYQLAVQILKKFPETTYYFLPEKVATYPIFVHGMKADSYTMFLRKKVDDLTATGIVSHFMKTPDLREERESLVSSIPLNYMLNVYILLAICIAISSAVFAGELVVFYCFDKRGPQIIMRYFKVRNFLKI